VIDWIESHPEGQRNRRATERRYYLGARYLREKQKHGTNRHTTKRDHGDPSNYIEADSAHAAGLQRLNVSGNRLPEAALTRLRGRFPTILFSPPPACLAGPIAVAV
jgi:hypothetical protein